MLLALLLVMQSAPAREAPPVLQFPTTGLDDPAAYEGYTARLYRDARGNAVEIYIEGKTGRVVHVWADALNESIGFTARNLGGQETTGGGQTTNAAVAFGDGPATVWSRGGRRGLGYALTVQGGRSIRIGQILLGSMRIERDFGYAGRVRDSIDAPTFVVPEMAAFAKRMGAPYTERLTPSVRLTSTPRDWTMRASQPSLDGRNHLWLTLRGDARTTLATLRGGVLTIRALGRRPVTFSVEIATDGAALDPLRRNQIFSAAFRRFADSVKSPRLEREIRGFELLSTKQKLIAALPTYATYFGRDMLLTALLMEPVWSDTMPEFVISAALAKLGPAGDVSHEEALGGQAIRENSAEFLKSGDRRLLQNLQATRENYWMVDDDFQLPVVAGRYFADKDVPVARKRRFVARWGTALRKNLAYVARQAAPYARDPVVTNLVSFKRDDNGWWHPGSWRDSRVGYGGGRFAFDVNVVWVPAALRAIGTIDSALRAMGQPGIENAAEIARAADTWRGTARHFMVALAPADVEARVRAKLASLPAAERAHWEAVVTRSGFPSDTLRFPAVSLDSAGQPIPVMSTDPAMWLLLERQDDARESELLRPFLLPYPVGLFIDGLGLAVANDAYAGPAVWEMFEGDLYHSPRVVWGREVSVLLAALAQGGRNRPGAIDSVRSAVARSGLQYAELWSYKFEGGVLRPVRYGSSSDVQLWSLTEIAVQYLLHSSRSTP
ncbi:MAG: hypothetical protein DMD58_12660 [Gemmatimonadetes bacterium]|nr:MAG: hypothetical protein DMD58_12660 [Gemmatimonadota bacterium]